MIFTDLCDKMSSAALRRRITNLAASEFSQVELSHLPAAEVAARFVRSPSSIDVVLADPLLGNLLFAQGLAMTGTPNLQCAAYFGYGKQGVYYNACPLPASSPKRGRLLPCILYFSRCDNSAVQHGLRMGSLLHRKGRGKSAFTEPHSRSTSASLPTVSASVFAAYIAQTAAEYISAAE